MSERLHGHRTKLNANKMTCDGRCSSRRKQPVFGRRQWTAAMKTSTIISEGEVTRCSTRRSAVDSTGCHSAPTPGRARYRSGSVDVVVGRTRHENID